MTAHIIHNSSDSERWERLMQEVSMQHLNYQLWPAIPHVKPFTGISQAHKQIVNHAMQSGWNEVLIMEDDVLFTSPNSMKYFLEKKPAVYDLYLGGIYWGSPDHEGAIVQFSALHCYICHSRFYNTFLAVQEDNHLDLKLRGLGRFLVCQPMIAKQYNGYSHNARQVVNYDERLSEYNFLT